MKALALLTAAAVTFFSVVEQPSLSGPGRMLVESWW